MQLTLRMLTETYIENPIIVDTRGADAAKNVSFGPSNNVLPTVATAGGVSKAPLTYKTFMALNTMFCNAMGLNTKKIEKTSMTFGDVERVAVFSNSGWNAFIAQNEHLGNRDFYGRPVEIKGYGVYEQFQGNIIVTIPDDAIPTWTNANNGDHGDRHIFDNASNALENAYLSFGKTYAAGKLNFLTGEKYTKGTNDTFGVTSGQHFFYLFYPDAFEMFEPQQFTVKPSVYDEQAKSLEKAIYVMQSLEGVRLYDHSIARVFFTGEFGKLDASV